MERKMQSVALALAEDHSEVAVGRWELAARGLGSSGFRSNVIIPPGRREDGVCTLCKVMAFEILRRELRNPSRMLIPGHFQQWHEEHL